MSPEDFAFYFCCSCFIFFSESGWYISKIQFIHNLNFGYAIAAWAPGLALTVCLMLFGFSWLVF